MRIERCDGRIDLPSGLEFLISFVENAENTVYEPFIPIVLNISLSYAFVWFLLFPVRKGILKLYEYFSGNYFMREVHKNLSFLESSDVYYAIKQYIPTRYSIEINPDNEEEPVPVYNDSVGEKKPLLLERFIKYEFDIRFGKKYYLCLADCGMGKTTFLINLYYYILKQKKYTCQFIGLQESDCLEQINNIDNQGETILLLDALDENKDALTDYSAFMEKLECFTYKFYRVIITSRANFFENETEERLFGNQKVGGTTAKLPKLRKFYITPFTEEDIQRFLNFRYRFNPKKKNRAWKIISENKNLSVRPLLLRFIDELLIEEWNFSYDFQLYEQLFQMWINRERHSHDSDFGNGLYNECLKMTRIIYYQWMKNGQTGIFLSDMKKIDKISELKNVQMKGHAILNRTKDGLYKFSHKSYWEYMLAKLSLTDIFFANELLIRNFDRATDFLEEMIHYYKTHTDEQTFEIVMGIAGYLMKYNKPEDAEKYYQKASAMCGENVGFRFSAMTQLAECFWRQCKYKSAEKILNECWRVKNQIPLKRITLPLYVQFGNIYAKYCLSKHLKSGQIYLQQLIEFCQMNNIFDYDLLRCYERYCYCCMNPHLKQIKLIEMDQIVRKKFEKDQYAEHLKNTAKSWKMHYDDINSLDGEQKLLRSGKRFMDTYSILSSYCNLAVSYATLGKNKWNQIGVEKMNEACTLCGEVYSDTSSSSLNNPYVLMIAKKMVLVLNYTKEFDKEKEYIDMIVQYIQENSFDLEMSVLYYDVLSRIINDRLGSFEKLKEVGAECLDIAQRERNEYKIIDTHWSLYKLYAYHGKKDLGQWHLREAYNLAKKSKCFYMESKYCVLLQVIILYYEGDVDKNDVAQELLDIVPNIYGSDMQRIYIYRTLRNYFRTSSNDKEVVACRELLRCELNSENLACFYESCSRYQQIDCFVETLNGICRQKGVLSRKESLTMEEFVDNGKNRIGIDICDRINTLLKQYQQSE